MDLETRDARAAIFALGRDRAGQRKKSVWGVARQGQNPRGGATVKLGAFSGRAAQS